MKNSPQSINYNQHIYSLHRIHKGSYVNIESNQDIAQQVGLHYNNVATWHSQFLTELPILQKIETDDPEKLEDEIRAV